MIKKFSQLDLKIRLIIIGVALGAIAIFAGDPYGGTTIKINSEDLSYSTMNDADKIDPVELANWIIQGKSDFDLVDLRTSDRYSEYSLPESENIPLIQLPKSDLLRNQKIILISDDEVAASQGWFILKANDFKGVYILKGGINRWKDQVLFPKCSLNASSEEISNFKKMEEISKYFGGQAMMVSSDTETATTTTQIQLPTSNTKKSGTTTTSPKKKKREGC
ncbi:MAG: rhodanese-like domain-containing protein [Ignavibacteriales bacterium]|nr:rhodanese-like domain-containing protein [Ignavibacteriales bacterium]